MIPTRGKVMCKIINREKVLPSGIIIPDRVKSEKKDNVAECIGVGDGVKMARRTDLIHYKENFGQKITYEGRRLLFLKEDEIIAIERCGVILALGSMVIVKLKLDEKIGTIIVPEKTREISGNFSGEVVSIGPDFMDNRLKVGEEIVYLRAEGYRFRTYETRENLLSVKDKWVYARKDN